MATKAADRTADTVFILGAGFSYDAQIPLMGEFVDKMWELATRRAHKGRPLRIDDAQLFDAAMKIRYELNEYHGRAAFDDRNIEDLLSILTFNAYLPQPGRPNRLAVMTKAIARTIELCCEVKHPGVEPARSIPIEEGSDLYRRFWASLLKMPRVHGGMPALLTFNYDLVLERAFFQTAIGKTFVPGYQAQMPFQRVRLCHHYAPLPTDTFELTPAVFGRSNEYNGTLLTPVQGAPEDGALEIDLLKLHGSLNFPARVMRGSRGSHSIATSLDDPFIMPPVFNKQSGGHQQSIWKRALEHLRGAKNVVIVGYSLPKTDIYMQYFLKAALGPNVNLNKIFVFDPALHRDGTAGREMEARYAECFSPQLKGRIDFRPGLSSQHPQQLGTAEQFVRTLENSPNSLIF